MQLSPLRAGKLGPDPVPIRNYGSFVDDFNEDWIRPWLFLWAKCPMYSGLTPLQRLMFVIRDILLWI